MVGKKMAVENRSIVVVSIDNCKLSISCHVNRVTLENRSETDVNLGFFVLKRLINNGAL